MNNQEITNANRCIKNIGLRTFSVRDTCNEINHFLLRRYTADSIRLPCFIPTLVMKVCVSYVCRVPVMVTFLISPPA
jgi:hypothetical protein